MSQNKLEENEIESKGYFKDEEMHKLLLGVETRYREAAIALSEDQVSDMVFFIVTALASMRNNYLSFENACMFNIGAIGRKFKNQLENSDPSNSKETEYLAALIFRFVFEFHVVHPADVSSDLVHGINLVRAMSLEHPAGTEIEYAQHSMLIGVLRKYLHHEEIVSIKRLPSTIARAVELNAESERRLEAREEKLKKLEGALSKLKISYDFIELASGFSAMRARKAVEKHFNFACLLFLAVMLILPAALKVYAYYFELKIPEMDVYTAVSIVALELVFVFFFRVALHNFRSVRRRYFSWICVWRCSSLFKVMSIFQAKL